MVESLPDIAPSGSPDAADISARAPLSDSLQDYLEAVYLLVQRHGMARMKEIASLVGVSRSSATGGVQALAERGLVNYDPYEYVTLSLRGTLAGRDLVRRHHVLKAFLMKVLGVPEEEAERVGCKMEHAIKGEVLERFVRFLEFIEQRSASDGPWRDVFEAFAGGRAAEGSAAPGKDGE